MAENRIVRIARYKTPNQSVEIKDGAIISKTKTHLRTIHKKEENIVAVHFEIFLDIQQFLPNIS